MKKIPTKTPNTDTDPALIHAPKILVLGVWTPKRDWSSLRPKRHILGRNRTYVPVLVQIGSLVRPLHEPKESKKERKKTRQGKKLTVVNWVFAQTTHVDAAICGLACWVVFGFQVSSKSVGRFSRCGGRNLSFPIPKASGLYNRLYYRTSRDYHREHICLPIHVQKITIIREQKTRKSAFEILYSILALSGGTGKNWNMDAQLQTIAYIKLQNFKKIVLLNSILVRTIGGTACTFWYHLHELDSFSWHHVMSLWNIFYTGTHLWYITLNTVVKYFFKFASKWPKW